MNSGQQNVNYSFYEFAKNYIRIKDGVSVRSLNNVELNRIKKMQQMLDNGYEMQMVRSRTCNRILWVKK